MSDYHSWHISITTYTSFLLPTQVLQFPKGNFLHPSSIRIMLKVVRGWYTFNWDFSQAYLNFHWNLNFLLCGVSKLSIVFILLQKHNSYFIAKGNVLINFGKNNIPISNIPMNNLLSTTHTKAKFVVNINN